MKTLNLFLALVSSCTISAIDRSIPPPRVMLITNDAQIIVTNNGRRPIELYYDHVDSFGELQMFYIRFRDRNGRILPLDGTRDGWFTPKIYYSSLTLPARKKLLLEPNRPVRFEKNTHHFVNWITAELPSYLPPCHVQFKLFGYVDNDSGQPIEAVSGWQLGPCPALSK